MSSKIVPGKGRKNGAQEAGNGTERETGRTERDVERVTHAATRNQTDKRERRAKSARQAGNWHGRSGNVGRTARDETGKRYGREGNFERVARDGTGSWDSAGGRR